MNRALAEGLRAFAQYLDQIADSIPLEDFDCLNYKSLKEAAEALGISEPSLRTLVHRDDFPGYKAGRRWVIPKKELAEWNGKLARERAEL